MHPPLEITGEIRWGVRYQIRKHRIDGHGDWINGQGRLQIPRPGKSTMDEVPGIMTRLMGIVRDIIRRLQLSSISRSLVRHRNKSNDAGERSSTSDDCRGVQTIVLGKVTYGAQIFAGTFMIFINYMQSMTLFLNMGVNFNFPSFLFVISNIYFFQIPFNPPECNVSYSYYVYWGVGVLMPAAISIVFGVVYFHSRRLQDPNVRRTRRDQCVQAVVIFLTVFYVDITSKAAEPLDCPMYDDGIARLDKDPSIICSVDDVKYVVLLIASISLFVLYGVGIPAFLLFTLVKAKRNSKLNTTNFVNRFGWLFQRYNSDHYYWEIVVLVRKFLLVFVVTQFNHRPRTLGIISIVILVCALYIHTRERYAVVINKIAFSLV